jgi:subtilisin family serine protease
MRIVSMRALAAAAAVLAAVSMSTASAAKPQVPPGDTTPIKPVFIPLGVDARMTTVVVKLSGAPVAEQEGNAGRRYSRAEKDNAKRSIKAQQDALRGSIQALGGTVIGSYQSAYNGMKVRIRRDKAAQLAALPGVVAVKPVLLMKPTNARSVPYIGAPAVWQSLGVHGEHIKVAIIDTGIDYTHANFGGPGTAAAYEAAHANETAPADPSLFGPAAPRVKGASTSSATRTTRAATMTPSRHRIPIRIRSTATATARTWRAAPRAPA